MNNAISGNEPNPILSVEKNGTVLYSNEEGEPLLREWGVTVGEKLPPYIGDIVQKVISRNSPERMEVKAGKRTYLIALHPSPKEECVNIYGFDISDQKELEFKPLENEVLEIANVELSEILDIQAVKPLMEDLYKLVHIPIGINDLKGNVLVGVGWQDICVKFHRVHPETYKHCVESDSKLSAGVLPGEFKLYKCKNNMYDIVTPIMLRSQHIGYVFGGQFFFDDEPLDYELFRSQARKHGFNEEEYITALEKVPRLSRETVNTGMSFFMTFANLLSHQSYSNIKLAKSLSERDTLLEALQESEEKYRNIVETANEGVWIFNSVSETTYVNEKMAEMLGYNREEMIGSFIWDYADEEDKGIFQVKLANRKLGIDEVYELKLLRKNGSPIWLLVSAKAFFDMDGKFAGSLGMFTDITDRKKTEEALRLSNLYNRSLIEASLDPLVIIGNDGNVTDVNKATEQATGYSRNDLIGTYFAYYLTEPDHAISAFIYVCTHGELRDCALEIKHRDGHITPVLCNASVYRDENGKVIGVFVAARDITERKKAEKALKKVHDSLEERVKERTAELERAYILLKESETGLAEAQKMAHIGNWEWDFKTDSAYWSEEMYRIFGRDPQELAPPYKEYLSYIHPDDREQAELIHKEAVDGKPFRMDRRIVLANGEVRLIHMQTEVILDDNNIPIKLKGTIQDITERKLVEEKLRDSEEKYRNIVETANEGINLINNEGVITYTNNKMADMLGYPVEEIVGRTIWDFVNEEDKPTVSKSLEKRRLGILGGYELKLIRKDGSPVWVFINSKPIFDDNSKFIGILTMHTDITKRKEAEEAMANIEIARQKEIHHRIKNNLQVISSLLDLQSDKFNNREGIKDSEVLKAFRESQDRVISMALIHEELYKGGGLDTLNFSQYIKELAESLLLTYRLDTDVHLNFNLEENLFLDMDTAIPLGIVINEIVSNSFKYAFSDRDKGEIRTKLRREEDEECKMKDCKSTTFTLSISDNGVGIPENLNIEDLDSLGLQLVTTLVEQLDGELEIKRNNGTEFIIRFTVTEKDNQASEPALHLNE